MEARHLPIPPTERSPADRARAGEVIRDGDRLVRRLTPFAGDAATTHRIALREHAYRRSLAVSDVLSSLIACVASVAIPGTADTFQPAALILIPILILSAKVLGLYDRDEVLIRKTTADEVPSLLQLATTFALVIWLGSSIFLDAAPAREQVLGLWVILFVTLVIGRWVVRGVLGRIMSPERCLVVGDAGLASRFDAKLHDNNVNANVVGRVAIDDVSPTLARFGPREFGNLAKSLTDLQVDRVVVGPDTARPELTLDIIRAAKSEGVRVSVVPHTLEVVGSTVTYDDLFGLPVLGVRRFGLTQSSRVLKRTVDLAGAGALLVVAAPFMAVIAVMIKLGSSGPVFFRQERMGRDGKTFRMLKFRTMVQDAEERKDALRVENETTGLFKIADDPRVTGIGRPLRRMSLDELPQVFNVLRGDMSLVGPRPLVPDEDAKITGLDRLRLDLMPGMTGPWQILGSTRVPMNEMVKIDYLYAANWSAWGDVKIMMRTVVYMLRRRGA